MLDHSQPSRCSSIAESDLLYVIPEPTDRATESRTASHSVPATERGAVPPLFDLLRFNLGRGAHPVANLVEIAAASSLGDATSTPHGIFSNHAA